MRAFVVDVNVAIVANGKSPQADLDCMARCVDALEDISTKGLIVLDDDMRILSEYLRHLSPKGEPGLGDAFMRWVWEHQAVVERCERVILTPSGPGEADVAEFPADPALASFDRNDRKYVAVALASERHPNILNAVDPDWWQYKDALARNGARLQFLCPQHVR